MHAASQISSDRLLDLSATYEDRDARSLSIKAFKVPTTGHGFSTITGIDPIEFSDLTLAFGTPASRHFGSVPLSGVVRTGKA
jgi:hypothetical protein